MANTVGGSRVHSCLPCRTIAALTAALVTSVSLYGFLLCIKCGVQGFLFRLADIPLPTLESIFTGNSLSLNRILRKAGLSSMPPICREAVYRLTGQRLRSKLFFQSPLLATMVDPEVVFVKLTGGFCHSLTPIQWDVVDQAIFVALRTVAPKWKTPLLPLRTSDNLRAR